MNELDGFFQTEVKAFDEEIKKIDKVLGEVIPTFGFQQTVVCLKKECSNYKDCTPKKYRHCYGYDITQYDEISGSIVKPRSRSTNAMMLSLAAYLQKPDFNSLFIKGKRSLTLPTKVAEKIREVNIKQIYKELINCFTTRHNHRAAPLDKGFHDNGSYSPNPWSTLAWFGEIMLFMEKDKTKPGHILD